MHQGCLQIDYEILKKISLKGILTYIATKEILWLQVLLIELGYIFNCLSLFIVIISHVLP
jgi:hypothetical protein